SYASPGRLIGLTREDAVRPGTFTNDLKESTWAHFSFHAEPGNSGSPVIGVSGKVYGVMHAIPPSSTETNAHLSIATSLPEIEKLLSQTSTPFGNRWAWSSAVAESGRLSPVSGSNLAATDAALHSIFGQRNLSHPSTPLVQTR